MVDHGTVIYTLGVLDAATGAYTAIGGTGATVGASGGLAFSEADGKLYAVFAATGGFYKYVLPR
jgi:hypothetical protein